MTNGMITCGVVGLGISGVDLHAFPLSRIAGFELKAVCDMGSEVLARVSQDLGVPGFSDLDGLLAEHIDLVAIATPPKYHFQMAKAALKAGKHVIIEKPMCLSVSECAELIRLAEGKGLLVTGFQNRRWDPDFRTVSQVIQEQILGDIFQIESRIYCIEHVATTPGKTDWPQLSEFGGGFLWGWGSHMFDQVLELLKRSPRSIYCRARNTIWSKEADDFFKCVMDFGEGLTVQVESSMETPLKLPRWYVRGSRGTLWVDASGARATDEAGVVREVPDSPYPDGLDYSWCVERYHKNICVFYTNILRHLTQGEELLVKPAEVAASTRVIECALESVEMGRAVDYD